LFFNIYAILVSLAKKNLRFSTEIAIYIGNGTKGQFVTRSIRVTFDDVE